METFTTQFEMAGTRTNVSVEVLTKGRFGFTLHLSDSFEGDELVPGQRDGIIVQDSKGAWQLEGQSAVALSRDDLENLGKAIERDYSAS